MDVMAEKETIVDDKERVWVKVPEAARHFSVARSRMYSLIDQGLIPAVRISARSIRVNLKDVERHLLEERRVAGSCPKDYEAKEIRG